MAKMNLSKSSKSSKSSISSISSRDLLPVTLNYRGLFGNGVEIGVATAKFSDIWISTCKLKKVFLVDPWKEYGRGEYKDGNNHAQDEQDKRYAMVQKKMSKYGARVEIIREESLTAVKRFDNGFFDFIYIDANHEYQCVKRDLETWYPKLKQGGIFSGHDYNNSVSHRANRFGEKSVCGVKSAVDEFCAVLGVEVEVTGGTRRVPPSWWFTKA